MKMTNREKEIRDFIYEKYEKSTFITANQVAEILNIGRSSVNALLYEAGILAHVVGKSKKYFINDIVKLSVSEQVAPIEKVGGRGR